VWISTADDRVYHSLDGGQTWDVIEIQSAPDAQDSFSGIAAAPDGRAWTVGWKGHIYSTGGKSTSSVEEVGSAKLSRLALSPIHPNPAGSEARFTLEVSGSQDVTVAVFDAHGRSVAVLHEGPLAAGAVHGFTLRGQELPSGIYLVRVDGESASTARKVTLLR
jgi:photosystem II stability/assembly factor-like uncharacterized protein